MRIEQIEGGPCVLWAAGNRIIAQGSRELCEAVRDDRVADYVARTAAERARTKTGDCSSRDEKYRAFLEAQAKKLGLAPATETTFRVRKRQGEG